MSISTSELHALLERLTALSASERITWCRVSDDVVQLRLTDFVVELAQVIPRSFRLAVTTIEGLPEGELADGELSGSEAAVVRRDLGYLFDLALAASVSETARRLLSQLPDE